MIDAIEPLGERGKYIRAGVVAAMIANVNRKEGATAFRESDIFPWLAMEEEEMEPEDFAAWMETAFPNAKRAG